MSSPGTERELSTNRLKAWRARVNSTPRGRQVWRCCVAVVGGLVLVAGIVAIPYPGPGWLIVFAGLGILATEFEWAKRLLRFARSKYNAFTEWLSRQNILVKGLFGLGTFVIVLLTLWLLGALKLAAGWVGIHWPWLASPILG